MKTIWARGPAYYFCSNQKSIPRARVLLFSNQKSIPRARVLFRSNQNLCLDMTRSKLTTFATNLCENQFWLLLTFTRCFSARFSFVQNNANEIRLTDEKPQGFVFPRVLSRNLAITISSLAVFTVDTFIVAIGFSTFVEVLLAQVRTPSHRGS